MANSRQFKVNGVSIQSPNNEPKMDWQSIYSSDSGRNLNGIDESYLVGRVWDITLNYTNLNDTQVAKLSKAVNDNLYNNLTFMNPYTGADTTSEFRTKHFNTTLKFMVNNICYWDVDVGFIERTPK